MSEMRVTHLSDAPVEVRRWIVSNFSSLRIDGFKANGDVVEIVYAQSTRDQFALIESLRRSLAALDAGVQMQVQFDLDEIEPPDTDPDDDAETP